MKLKIPAILISLFLTACSQAEPNYGEWLSHGVLIDTRTQEEFNSGYVPGAVLIPYDEIAQRIIEVAPDKSTPVLLYCRSGRRAGIAEDALKKLGYEKVHNLGSLQDAAFFVSEQNQ